MYNHANPEPGKVCNDFCNLSSRANRADFASNTSDRDMPTHQRRKALASRPREHNENLPSQITSDGGGGSSRDGRHGPAAARSAAARPADPRLAAGAGHCPSPLIGSGIDRNSVPAATHVQDYRDIERRGVPDLLWSLNQEIGAVSIDSASGNPFQPSFNYRGFTASPLQGRPQGLAVYVNGMRFNQPFGDTVDWDLIPNNAIDSLNVEGSNPVFGLNALGGSVNVQMKNGFTWQGGELSLSGGSFGQRQGEFQWGRQFGSLSAYMAGTVLHQDGWRDLQSSDLQNTYGDIGWRGSKSEVHLNFTYAHSDLNGPGTSPVQLLAVNPAAQFTAPNFISNSYAAVSLNGTVDLSDQVSLQGLAYYRYFRQNVSNGNAPNDTPCTDDDLAGFLCTGSSVSTTFGG